MKIVIDIPENFESHFYQDRFRDSLQRLLVDTHLLAGSYERELVAMLVGAFRDSTMLRKGHGRLIDAEAFERRCMFDESIEDMQDMIYALRDYPSDIKADRSEE